MIQVAGTTYRIEATAERHEVIRICDDRKVGVFVHQRSFQVLECAIGVDDLMAVAQAALHAGRLEWHRPAAAERSPSASRMSATSVLTLSPSR